jgi:hypothetical protein
VAEGDSDFRVSLVRRSSHTDPAEDRSLGTGSPPCRVLHLVTVDTFVQFNGFPSGRNATESHLHILLRNGWTLRRLPLTVRSSCTVPKISRAHRLNDRLQGIKRRRGEFVAT